MLAKEHPERLADLMAYQALIARASRKYRWPSWLVYDQNFRQEAAGNPELQWGSADPSMYTQCFTGQELCGEGWRSRCQSLDHAASACPLQPAGLPRRCTWSNGPGSSLPARGGGRNRLLPPNTPICDKYNKYDMDCMYGDEFRLQPVSVTVPFAEVLRATQRG